MTGNNRMISKSNILHVIIPGLATYQHSYSLAYSSCLEKMLKTAVRTAIAEDYYGLIYSLFQNGSDSKIPAASVAALRQSVQSVTSDDFYLCADPVYMQADRDQLLMFDSQELEISESEAKAIVESLNSHFMEDGLEFSVIESSRWLVKANSLKEVATSPLYRVVNRPLLDVMPQGSHGAKWKAIINEIQMLLHNHEVNDVRQEKGMKTINGIWFWGEAMSLQAKDDVTSSDGESVQSSALVQLYSDDLWLCRLAKGYRVPVRQTSEIDKGVFKSPLNRLQGDSLYIDSQLSNEYGRLTIVQFKEWLIASEKKLWLPIRRKLFEGIFNQVNLYPGDGYCYKIKHQSLLRRMAHFSVTYIHWIRQKLGRKN